MLIFRALYQSVHFIMVFMLDYMNTSALTHSVLDIKMKNTKKIHSERRNSFTTFPTTRFMLLRDVDQLLDMQCVVSIRDGYELLDFSEKFNLRVSCTALIENNRINLVFFIRKEEAEKRDVRTFLDTFKAKDRDGLWVVELSESMDNELNVIKDFISIPSVILDQIYLEHGAIYVKMRFHRNYLESVSAELMKAAKETDKVSLEYLGKSNGLISILRQLDKSLPLFYLSLDSEPPESAMNNDDVTVPGKWIREIKFSSDDLIKGVYTLNSSPDNLMGKLQEISKSENIYEGGSRNAVLDFFRKRTVENFIPTFAKIQGYDGKKMSMDFIVPQSELQKLLTVLSDTLNAFPEWKINMANAGKFSSLLGEE